MKFIAITNDQYEVEQLAHMIASIYSFVDYVHIREKSKTAKELWLLIETLQQLAVPLEKLVIHDRLDVAVLASIPNIHLPSYSLPIDVIRQMFPHLRIGRSVHTVEEAIVAARDGADYVLYGHCFETDCKQGIKPNGLLTLQEIQQALHIPVFAIGGITIERVNVLQRMDCAGFAVMSSVFSATNPVEVTDKYVRALKGDVV